MQTHRKYLRHTTTSMATDSKLGPQILAAFAGTCFKQIISEIVSIEIIIYRCNANNHSNFHLQNIATIGAFVLGNALGWSSPALSPLSPIVCSESSLNSSRFKYCVDENESRWIGSLLAIGALIASQVSHVVMSNYMFINLKSLSKILFSYLSMFHH